MKKSYLIGLFATFTLGVNAQKSTVLDFPSRLRDGKLEKPYKQTHDASVTPKAAVWSNNFSTAADWVISNATNDPQNWVITSASNTTMGYNTGSWVESSITVSNENGYALFDSDGVGADGGVQNAFITTANAIDLSTKPNVVLQFSQRVRLWNTTQTIIQVSNNGGTTWTDFPMNVGRAKSIVYEEIATVNISSAAGGYSNVKIRFNYKGSWDYAWMVDDVSIIEQPADDLKALTANVVGASNVGIYYGRTPLAQVDPAGYVVSGSFTNFGTATQTATSATANFTSFSANFAMGSVIPGDTVAYDTLLTPALSIGQYNGVYTVTSAQEEVSGSVGFTNNTLKRNFAITPALYSLDGIGIHPAQDLLLSGFGSQSFGNPTDTYLANFFDLKAATNIISGIEVELASSTAAGGELEISIVDTATFFADGLTPVVDINGYSAQGLTYYITAADITAGKVQLPFPQPIRLGASPYYALVKTSNSGNTPVRIKDDQTVAQPWYASMVSAISSSTNSQTSYSNGNAHAIRLIMSETFFGLNEIANQVGLTVYPNPTNANTTVSLTLKNEATVSIQLTDLAGKVINTIPVGKVTGEQQIAVDTDTLTSGIYMVNVSIDGAIATEKLIIRK